LLEFPRNLPIVFPPEKWLVEFYATFYWKNLGIVYGNFFKLDLFLRATELAFRVN